MFKGVFILFFSISCPSWGEDSHIPTGNRTRPVYGEQGGTGNAIDPCFPGRLSAGQVTIYDGIPPAQPTAPKESSNSKKESARPEPVDDQPVKGDRVNERVLPISFDDEADCRKELSKIEKKMRGNYGSHFQCELRNSKKVLARETSENYCNSTRDGDKWTDKGCGKGRIEDLLEALSKYACRNEKVIERTTSIKCEYTDDMIFETIRFVPPEK